MLYDWLMGLYISQGVGMALIVRAWNPGDHGSPNRADSKQELLSYCPLPDPHPCRSAECDSMGMIIPGRPTGHHRFWTWSRQRGCRRCSTLRYRHHLELAEFIALWEAQGRRCYRYPECPRMLADPRTPVNGKQGTAGEWEIRIDHDHRVCPRPRHSCDQCRRGLVCTLCNVHELSVRSVGFWLLPERDGLRRWLEFLGPADRDRLRDAIGAFPDRPVRRVPRRQEPQEAAVIPLFGAGDFPATA